MADQLQLRGGTTAEHATFTGALREVTVDTDKDTVVVHDNATAGGHPLAKENLSNVSAATAATKLDGQTVKFGLGAAATPSVTFNGDLNTGVYSPGADQVAISTGGSGRLFVDSSGNVGINTASTIAPGGFGYAREFALTGATSGDSSAAINIRGSRTVSGGFGDINFWHQSTSNRAYIQARRGSSDSAIDLDFITSGGGGMRITSAGLVGVGTSSPTAPVHIKGDDGIKFENVSLSRTWGILPYTGGGSPNANFRIYDYTAGADRLNIDTSGRVGIGTTTVSDKLHIGAGNICLSYADGSTGLRNKISWRTESPFFDETAYIAVNRTAVSSAPSDIIFAAGGAGSATEKARLTSDGKWLVGTSTARSNYFNTTLTAGLQVEGTGGSTARAGLSVVNNDTVNNPAYIVLGRSGAASLGSNTGVASGDWIGTLSFQGTDGSELVELAAIQGWVDGTPGANDMPGRLVFSTTADGASSPTERMRIVNTGDVLINKTGVNDTTAGFRWSGSNYFSAVRSGGAPGYINRLTDDGVLLEFAQDNVTEGSVSVSGTTVSYNGAHLSRWSQLPSGAERTEILRGSVLSNIDEMCEWGDEDNEQLNRMKVSDVEGDKNVSGVFQAWDDDDDTYVNDFYCAMTGDFVIRIAAGVTVERGDLLMSAGDGTAKPQADDAVRSCTVAKVTSTHVSHTHPDGSYCVPCVLMAC